MRDQSQVDVLNRILNFTIILFLGPLKVTLVRDDHFQFGSVRFLSKKVTKPKFFLKKNRNQVKPTGFGSVRFFRAKTGSNRFGSVFPVWLGFSVLARFFLVWLGFFRFFRFWFGSVWFFAYKTETEPNRTGQFFQNFNRFFFSVRFFRLFFFWFSWFNRFFRFFAHP